MIDLLRDPEFWVGIGTLMFFAIIIWKRVPALVTNSLDARAAAIAKELDEARRLRTEAEVLLADYRRKREAADAEASSILTEARAEAELFAAEARAASKAQTARRAKQAVEKIAQAEAHALADIRAAAADSAIAAAEKIIAARLDESSATELVRRSLKEIPGRLQ
jgi:F-type H+-transporting ATPase subunit b